MDTDTIPEVPNDDPETFCRLCFSGFYVEPLFPVDAEPKQSLIDLISKHVEIHITLETDYPCSVCRMCQMTLEGFHKYRERCLKLDEVLQRKRMEVMQLRVKVEHQEDLAQNAVGFEDDTVYCLSDTDDEEQPQEGLEEQHEDLSIEHHPDMEDDADEEDLIKGDILIKPEPYSMEDEFDEEEHDIEDQHYQRPVKVLDENEVVVLDSEEDEQSMEASTRASSEALLDEYGKDEPTKALPFEVTSDGAYECTICKEVFRLMKEIKTHMRKVHPQESQIYPCHYCSKKFSDTGSLRFHTRFHTLDFPYTCDECGAKFTMKTRLDKHKARYHDKDSPSYTDKRFNCTLCPRIFLQEQARNMHMTHFHEVKPSDPSVEPTLPVSQVFFCDVCNESLDSQQTWTAHLQERHPTAGEEGGEPKIKVAKRYKCPDCGKLFRHRTAFRSHIMINHGTMPHKCDICGSSFERKTKLTNHKERWHGENSRHKVLERYKCDQCDRFFVRNQDRFRHEQIIHSIEAPAKLPSVWEGKKSNFPCSKCERKFPTMKTMRIHFSLKHPEVPVRFKCTVCSKLFKHKTSLRDHMVNHTGQQPYGCDECDERFVRKKDMERHVEEYHGADADTIEHRERFACKYCPRTLLSKTARVLHVKHHHADKEPLTKQVLLSLPDSLTCSYCKKTFTNRNTLKLHVLNHMGKLPHVCDQCDAGFYKPADLLKHKQRYHVGGSALSLASRFKCAYCPRIFIRKSARRYHHTVFHGIESKKSVSTSNRPLAAMRSSIKPDPDAEYPCSLCSLVFVTNTMLQTHHQQHHPDQEFFYKCPHCPKRTTHRNTYLSHMKVHVGGYRHPCDECNAQFDRKILLVGHKQRYHSAASKNSTRFRCTLCEREFVRNQDRVRHQIAVHNYQVKGTNPGPSPGPSKASKAKMKLFKIKQERLADNSEETQQEIPIQQQEEEPPQQEEHHEHEQQDVHEQQQEHEQRQEHGQHQEHEQKHEPELQQESHQGYTVTEAYTERSKQGFEVSSDVEEYTLDDDDDEGEAHGTGQQTAGQGDVSETAVPTISEVVSIKQEAIAARKAYSEYPSEF